MSNIIRIKRGITGGVVPTGLTFGELAVNITDKILFVGGQTGTAIQLLGGDGGGGVAGVQSLNGLTGALTLTSGSNITLTQAGRVITISASVTAGDVIADLILASTSITGIASFDQRYFTVSTTGHVGFASAYQVTGDTVFVDGGLASVRNGNSVTITNVGVTAFNGLTGSVSLTGDGSAIFGYGNNAIGARLATTGVTGVASFNPTYFTVSNGAVSLVTSYSATGDTFVAGSGIGTVRSGNQVTVSNAGVLAFNGLTGQSVTLTGDGGAVYGVGNNTIAARNATTSLTGVASFNANDFGVSATGHVSLTGNVARTNAPNTFTASQSIASGGLGVSAGATFDAAVRFNGSVFIGTSGENPGIEISRRLWGYEAPPEEGGATGFHNIIKTATTQYIVQESGGTANSIRLSTNGVFVGSYGGLFISPNAEGNDGEVNALPAQGANAKLVFTTIDSASQNFYGTLSPATLSSNRTYTLPDTSGTIAIVTPSGPGSNIIRSLNGATSGDVSVTGDGSALFGYNNSTNSIVIGAKLASAGTTGVASFDSSTLQIGSTGHVAVKTGIKANNIVILGTSLVYGAGATGALPAVDGSQLLEVNAKYLDGKTRTQITDGGTF